MSVDDIQLHIDALRRYAEKPPGESEGTGEVRIKKMQLRLIDKTIRQLEKGGVPVPQSLQVEKATLLSDIEGLERSSGGCVAVYEQVLEIVAALGRSCGRRPHQELYQKAKERQKRTTGPDVLRKVIIAVLKESGGSAHLEDLTTKVGQQLKDRLTEADLDRPKGKLTRWQRVLQRERRSMIKDGILTGDSRSTWTLA